MGIIELKDVSFCYPNGFLAVENLSLSIERGEKIAIIGENGAGKSTTAKLINGLNRPTSGDVIIDGVNTRDKTPAQIARKVGYMFQNPGDQIYNADVFKEVSCTLRYDKRPAAEIEEITTRILKLVRLNDKRNDNPYELSFSHRRFVTMGAVLAMGTDVVVLDEPTAGQDKDGLDRLRDVMDYLTEKKVTVLTITHDMEFVVENFERVVVMANKHIIADAPKSEVFWNFPVLEKACLDQPHMSQLARRLGLDGKILDIDGLLSALECAKKPKAQ